MMFAPQPSAVIKEITALGPFFSLGTHPAGAAPAEPWVAMAGPLIEARVAAVREWLAAAGGQPLDAVEVRVAASVTHLGLAARLLSPALAAYVLHGRVLAFGLADVHWQPVLGGPVPLSLPTSAVRPGSSEPEGFEALLDGPLAELGAAMRPFALSPHIARGNLASALNGATTMISAARPDLASRSRAALRLLLDGPALRDSATTGPNGAFRRRSCCLIYRSAPGHRGALCGDCVLDRPAAATAK
ncbi:(2Fe-2S)-binding protein [Streptomyces sp. NBC_00083]|uniref:(2Fe-2S)-binding protein n=1 Tax=Streptomyces sp. NBC_00083 TaxID=2975647 RepID=UPI0022585A39|nr:(2Fe-2S)-binding protein [Streptomyces sp. NBC_00083]MCX5384151.1 (2Fe-2S)-binding protein [Streptomyces sp. NBC_00083]